MPKEYHLSDFRIIEYDTLSSTNTEAAALRAEERTDKTVVMTRRQVAGRGEGSNHWESEPDKNLAFSILLRPTNCEASRQFAVSMAVALGCADFVAEHVPNPTIKWPNDIYVGDRKIAGILIEHCISGSQVIQSVCGIGVNLNQEHFLSDAPNPVSLRQLTGKTVDMDAAFARILSCIDHYYGQLNNYASLEQAYLSRMYRREGVFEWEDARRGKFSASISGVDEFGRLVLRDEADDTRTYGFKEVRYVLP